MLGESRGYGEGGSKESDHKGFVGHCKDFGFYGDRESSEGRNRQVTGKPIRRPTPSSREDRMVTWSRVVAVAGMRSSSLCVQFEGRAKWIP